MEAPVLRRSPLLWLALAVFFAHSLVSGGHLLSPDGELLYRTAESIALRGTTRIQPLETDPATGELLVPGALTFATRQGRQAGEFYAQYLPLQPFLTAPVIWGATLIEGTLAEPFSRIMWPNMTATYVQGLGPEREAEALFRRGLVVMFFNPLVNALTALLIARLGTLLTGSRRAGILTALLYAFGTMAWPHSRSYFTEPLAGLLAIGALDQLCRWYLKPAGDREKHALAAGVLLGLANWTRVDSPALTAGFLLGMSSLVAWRWWQEVSWNTQKRRPALLDILLLAIPSIGAWALLQGFNALRFGGVDLTAGYADQAEAVKFATPLFVGLQGLLFSTGKGLFWFSPALLAGLVGWRFIPREQRWLLTLVILGYLPFFLAMAKWQNWEGGWCWGPRHIFQLHAPLMLGTAFLISSGWSTVKRISLTILFIVGAFVQIYGTSQSPLEYYHEFFRTIDDGEYYRQSYRPNQETAIAQVFGIYLLDESGQPIQRVPAASLPAPMANSLYIPQQTQWNGYARMWKMGYCDWFWWNVLFPYEGPDRWQNDER